MNRQQNSGPPKILQKSKCSVRLSSVSSGVSSDLEGHPNDLQGWSQERRELIRLIEAAGFTVRNGSGDEVIGLDTIQERSIKVSDAFVFMPCPTLAEVFKLASILVGYQTDDPELTGKPTILLDLDDSWEPVLVVLDHFHRQGMMLDHRELLIVLNSLEQVVPALEAHLGVAASSHLEVLPQAEPLVAATESSSNGWHRSLALEERSLPEFNVGVFCSASSQNQRYQGMARELGCLLARRGDGIVFGAGSTGMMGELMRGAVEHGGFVRGANIERIARVEGIPAGLNWFWGEDTGIDDIYKRLAVMVDQSDAFVILPGGAGTLQELLALLLLLREEGNPLMLRRNGVTRFKEIVVVSAALDEGAAGFYHCAVEMIKAFGYQEGRDFHLVSDAKQAVKKLEALGKAGNPSEDLLTA